jgi:hypothetical protein
MGEGIESPGQTDRVRVIKGEKEGLKPLFKTPCNIFPSFARRD